MNVLYILLLAFEAYIDLMCAGLMYSWDLWGVGAAVLLVLVVSLTALILRLKKHRRDGNAAGIRRVKTGIALVMLLPVLPVIAVAVLVALTLALYG